MMFKKTDIQKQAIELLTSKARHIMLFGGSRSGKTSILLYAMIVRACMAPGSRHIIIRNTMTSVMASIWLDSLPGMFAMAFPDLKVEFKQARYYVKFPNGSEIWVYGLDSGKTDRERSDKILGTEYSTIFFNECSLIMHEATQKALSRLAQKNSLSVKAYYDCNPGPKSHWTYKLFIDNVDPISGEAREPAKYRSLLMNPKDNAQNLSEGYIEDILSSLTHRQRQRLEHGLWSDDMEGALWNSSMVNDLRVNPDDQPDEYEKIVVGVDPAVSKSKTSDETGIIVCGYDDGIAYVLEDCSGKYTPAEWAKVVSSAADRWDADLIIAEKNQGGDMVKHTLQCEDLHMPIRLVSATKGKEVRAEPIVAQYENGFVKHVGPFPELEDQMYSWVPSVTGSPDRVDALVYSLSHLLLNRNVPIRSFTI